MDPTAAGFVSQGNAQGYEPVPALLTGNYDGIIQYPMLTSTTYPNRSLPIPSPDTYQDIYYPPSPTLRPLLQYNRIPDDCISLPFPRGNYSAQAYNLLGLPIHRGRYVRNNPSKLFTRWLDWWIEIDESLIRRICPADLNNLPCPWDELQGGCPMLRLCISKRKYQHPHLGSYPECIGEERNVCLFIHDIESTCWSLHEQLVRAPSRQFRSYQSCPVIAKQTNCVLPDISSYCKYGHDLEGARVEAWWNYWEHRVQAMRCGAEGVITEDRFGTSVRIPLRPKRQTLENTSYARSLDGSLSGRTWHGDWVTLTCMVGSDRPLDGSGWLDGDDMVVDWERCELRPLRRVEKTPVSRLTTRDIERSEVKVIVKDETNSGIDADEVEQEQEDENTANDGDVRGTVLAYHDWEGIECLKEKWFAPKFRRCKTV